MPPPITSAQVAAAYGLSATVATELPLVSRLEEAVSGLQAMEACHAQGWYDLSADARSEATERVFTSLRSIPEIVTREEYRALETASADPKRFAAEVANLRGPLQQQSAELRQIQDQAQTEQLQTMTQIVSGGRPTAGLPDVRSVVASQTLPEWTRRIAYRNGQDEGRFELNARGEAVFRPGGLGVGVDLVFRSGRFWVRDSRDVSKWDLRNLVRSAGVFVGQKDALRLKPGVLWPVEPGEAVRLGKKAAGGLVIQLPRAPLLEGMRSAIAVVPSLKALSRLLRTGGVPDIADRIDRFLKDGTPFGPLPMEGGLALKVQELVLKAEFSRLHNTYLPGVSEGLVGQIFRSLALAIADAHSGEELVRAVASSLLPGASALGDGIALFLAEPDKQSIDVVTKDFGLRELVVFYSKQAAEQLERKAAEAERRGADLAARLEEAVTELAEKTSALAAAERAAREQAAERSRLEEERRRADEEKERQRRQQQGDRDERHEEELEELEERLEAEKAAVEERNAELARQMEVLEAARAQLQIEKEALEITVARLTTQTELAEAEKTKAQREAAEWQRKHDEIRVRLSGEHDQAIAALQSEHASALAALEEKRAAEEAKAAGLARQKASLEAERNEARRQRDANHQNFEGEKAKVASREQALAAVTEELRQLKETTLPERASAADLPADEKTDRIQLPEGAVLDEGSSVALDPTQEIIVGRGRDAHIRVDERNVSRNHFNMLFHDGKWWIRDAGSSYGTFVNGENLDETWKQLAGGEAISVGRYESTIIQFVLDQKTGQAYLQRGEALVVKRQDVSEPETPEPGHAFPGK